MVDLMELNQQAHHMVFNQQAIITTIINNHLIFLNVDLVKSFELLKNKHQNFCFYIFILAPAQNPCTAYGPQFYPLPGSPQCYIQCVFETPFVKPCPSILVWNAQINNCDWPATAQYPANDNSYSSPSYGASPNNYGSSSVVTSKTSSGSVSPYSYGRKKRSTMKRNKRFMSGGSGGYGGGGSGGYGGGSGGYGGGGSGGYGGGGSGGYGGGGGGYGGGGGGYGGGGGGYGGGGGGGYGGGGGGYGGGNRGFGRQIVSEVPLGK
jgi:hypothetical protein